jgi:MFS family permease
MTGLVGQTVEADQMQQAGALMGLSGSVSAILGPSLAGVLVVLIGAGWGLAIDVLTFVLSAVFLSQLRVPNLPAAEHSNVLEDLRLGWRTYRSLRVPPEQLSRIAALDAVGGSALQPSGSPR